MDYEALLSTLRKYAGTLTRISRCLKHSKPSVTYGVFKSIANGRAHLQTFMDVAHCAGVPAWYLLFLLTEDAEDAAFRRSEKMLVEDLERMKAHNQYAAWAYYIENLKRGNVTPGVKRWADENL